MQVKIPKDSVGIVIGRQGANIREIQVETPFDRRPRQNQDGNPLGSGDFSHRPRLRRGSTSEMSLRQRSTGWLQSGWIIIVI